MELTKTQKKALAALQYHGGSGVVDKNGHVLAQGEVLCDPEGIPYSAATWLRLMTFELLISDGPHRLRTTTGVSHES